MHKKTLNLMIPWAEAAGLFDTKCRAVYNVKEILNMLDSRVIQTISYGLKETRSYEGKISPF
jgi:hypothetical protein